MKRVRISIALFTALILLPLIAQAFQTQRDQIGVTIIINATPNPLARLAPPAPATSITVGAHLEGAPAPIERAFEAEQLHFQGMGPNVVAQTAQKSVRVEASIAPNPNATLLYSDQNAVVLNAEAGVSTQFPCAYHVTVHTTVTSWILKQGLSNDFSGPPGGFPGGDVANNSYLGTPQPTATPFAVYADDGNLWTNFDSNGGIKTYCVDLTVNMPIATPQGTYTSNAIYTLYF